MANSEEKDATNERANRQQWIHRTFPFGCPIQNDPAMILRQLPRFIYFSLESESYFQFS